MFNTWKKIKENLLPDTIILFTCQDTYTYTKNCTDAEITFFNPNKIPVLETNRGGKLTYHGLGQRMIYPILNLNNYKKDVRWYIQNLQTWIIKTLDNLGIACYSIENVIGVWAKNNSQSGKIASIGIRIQKWITLHGICVNLFPDLKFFENIAPCGITGCKVVSCKSLGYTINYKKFDEELKINFDSFF